MMDYLIEPSSAEEGGRVADGCSFTRYFKTSVKLPYKSQFIVLFYFLTLKIILFSAFPLKGMSG